mmetsp:Transcript_2928/g.10444  ORF Transcript_2928/g.10444 Transcript_2928/m.10444 type:complete len:443 (+) Transcript_2928:1834-3162(+)
MYSNVVRSCAVFENVEGSASHRRHVYHNVARRVLLSWKWTVKIVLATCAVQHAELLPSTCTRDAATRARRPCRGRRSSHAQRRRAMRAVEPLCRRAATSGTAGREWRRRPRARSGARGSPAQELLTGWRGNSRHRAVRVLALAGDVGDAAGPVGRVLADELEPRRDAVVDGVWQPARARGCESDGAARAVPTSHACRRVVARTTHRRGPPAPRRRAVRHAAPRPSTAVARPSRGRTSSLLSGPRRLHRIRCPVLGALRQPHRRRDAAVVIVSRAAVVHDLRRDRRQELGARDEAGSPAHERVGREARAQLASEHRKPEDQEGDVAEEDDEREQHAPRRAALLVAEQQQTDVQRRERRDERALLQPVQRAALAVRLELVVQQQGHEDDGNAGQRLHVRARCGEENRHRDDCDLAQHDDGLEPIPIGPESHVHEPKAIAKLRRV